jgi:hypothetical protein|tara:strand:+ start:213 stop:467 length:255 start_codon:yes stop_codon:yes gene_type:complete
MLSPKIIIEERHNVTMAIKSIYPVNSLRAKAPNAIIMIKYPTSGDKRIALKKFSVIERNFLLKWPNRSLNSRKVSGGSLIIPQM